MIPRISIIVEFMSQVNFQFPCFFQDNSFGNFNDKGVLLGEGILDHTPSMHHPVTVLNAAAHIQT